MTAVFRKQPALTENDINTMMKALFDIRRNTRTILDLLGDDDGEEEEEQEDDLDS